MFVGLVIRSGAGPRRFLELTKSASITPEDILKWGSLRVKPDVRTASRHGIEMPCECHLYLPSDNP